MRKSLMLSAVLLVAGLLAAGPSFGAKGRFFAHGNNKLGKNTLTVKQARLAVANAINLQSGATLKNMRMRVRPEQIQITLQKTVDGQVLFAAKLKADGRTRQAKKFNATAEFRGVLDIQLKNPSPAAIRDAAYFVSKSKNSADPVSNWLKAEKQLKYDLHSGNRVRFFSGKIDSKFNDIARTLK